MGSVGDWCTQLTLTDPEHLDLTLMPAPGHGGGCRRAGRDAVVPCATPWLLGVVDALADGPVPDFVAINARPQPLEVSLVAVHPGRAKHGNFDALQSQAAEPVRLAPAVVATADGADSSDDQKRGPPPQGALEATREAAHVAGHRGRGRGQRRLKEQFRHQSEPG